MSWQQWAKMPCNWQTNPEAHLLIGEADTGAAIAALKLYIALCLKANYKPNKTFATPGMVRLSVDRLCALTGVSKPMTIAGLRLLQTWGVIQCHGGRPAVYEIVEYNAAPYWTKLPCNQLYAGWNQNILGALEAMANRGKTRLHALQAYLYLASIRDKSSLKARVAYTQFSNVLGISRNDISSAISTLVNDDLIAVRLGELTDFSETGRPSNEYWLRGTISDDIRETVSRAKGMQKWNSIATADEFVDLS
jgi:hypothetical protein